MLVCPIKSQEIRTEKRSKPIYGLLSIRPDARSFRSKVPNPIDFWNNNFLWIDVLCLRRSLQDE